jgi:hypothetical protein
MGSQSETKKLSIKTKKHRIVHFFLSKFLIYFLELKPYGFNYPLQYKAQISNKFPFWCGSGSTNYLLPGPQPGF